MFSWRNRPNFTEIVIAALFGFYFPYFQDFAKELIAPYNMDGHAKSLFSFILASVFTLAVLYLVIGSLMQQSIKFQWVRATLRPTGRFEGVWVERTSIPERPYALVCVYYDSEANDFFVRGWAFDRKYDGVMEPGIKADWDATSVHYDVEQRILLFYSRRATIGNKALYNLGVLDQQGDSFKGDVCDLYGDREPPPGSAFPVSGFKVEKMTRVPDRIVIRQLRGRKLDNNNIALELFKAWSQDKHAKDF